MKDRAAEFGFAFDALNFDWSKIVKRSQVVSEKGSAGVDFLFKKNKIDPLRGEASLDKPGKSKCARRRKEETHSAKNILIATGCVSRPLPGLPFDGRKLSARGSGRPGTTAFIRCHYRRRSHRHRIRLHLQCFRHESDRCRNASEHSPNRGHRGLANAGKSLSKQGIQLLTNHKTTKTEANDQGVKITVADSKGSEKTLDAEIALVAIGVAPVLPGGSLRSAWMRIYQGQ